MLMIVPFKVAGEIRRYRGPRSEARDWVRANTHMVKRFQTTPEHVMYARLTAEWGERLGEGERAAIAMAHHRGSTFVSDDKLARQVAETYGVVAIDPWQFRDYIMPRLDL